MRKTVNKNALLKSRKKLKMKEEKNKVLEAARLIPIDQLYALQPSSNHVPNRNDVIKPRKRK
jgi:H2-forming N5,N10-methylenetetrahydromethanopterin dehydrogenase-like enzyme